MSRALKVFSNDEMTKLLLTLEKWKIESGKLHRDLLFKNFQDAFSFMTSVALKAETMDHHPEWSNVYNRVGIDLFTHDCEKPEGGLTQLDADLAQEINRLASRYPGA